MLEGRNKKGRFAETNPSEYFISKSKMQDIFEPGFASHRIKQKSKSEDHLNNLSTNKIGGKWYI